MKKYIPFFKPSFSAGEARALGRVVRSGWLTTGRETALFEKEFKRFSKARHAVGVTSCTAGMHLCLLSLGIGRGDKVVTSTLTFASTANVIIHVGAEPVFVDVNEDDFTFVMAGVEHHVARGCRAVIPVHYAGAVCDLSKLQKLKKEYGVKIIQDAAHCIEGNWKGKSLSSYGDAVCFSFYATKNITTGEGGMVTLNDPSLADKIRIMSLHGLSCDAWKRYTKKGSAFYQVLMPGYKYNMFDLQAAIGREQLKKIRHLYRKRKSADRLYRKLLSPVDGIRFQRLRKEGAHAHHLFVVDLNTKKSSIRREKLMDIFRKAGIGFSVHFTPLHMHRYYKEHFKLREKDFPVASRLARDIISLPFYPDITEKDIRRVVACVKQAYKR
ncbi:MAG: DegT/DnrJ/EryC1/StrS aminotransferase family protein [Candidatus Aureabacteria bacterium]|nr:DegT/DnrJ/EryC1/StrS aminotransferase family protein [Candidatus Auribacterota bacterium]